MKWYQKLKSFFSKPLTAEAEDRLKKQAPECISILQLNNKVFHPADFMEALGCAIVMHSMLPAYVSYGSIKLYKVRSQKDNSVLGSFFALFHNNRYYGSMVNSNEIITCTPNAFILEETSEVIIPLQKDGEEFYALTYRYDSANGAIKVKILKKLDQNSDYEKIIHRFLDTIPLNKALAHCINSLPKA